MKIGNILDLIKSNVEDLEIVSTNRSDRSVVLDAIDNLLYSVIEYKKAFDEGRQ